MVFKIQFYKGHFNFAVRALERVIPKREEDHFTPPVKTAENGVPGRKDGPAARGGVSHPVPCIKPIVARHFKIPFRDMLDQELYEVNNRDSLVHKDIVLMPVVMESDIFPVIGVDTGKSNDRAPQVAADIFNDGIGVRKGRLCIDIKAVLIFVVDKCLGLFEGGSDSFFHFIEKDSLESLAQVSIIKMLYSPPESIVREAALCDEAVDMRVPFQGSSESMEDTDKARYKVLGHVELIEHMGHDTADGLEKAVEERTVFQEEMPELLINGKDAVAVVASQEFEGHGGGPLLAVLYATGRAETALAAKRDKLHLPALGAGIHGSAERRVAAVYHLFDVLHFDSPGMERILDDFIIIFKNLL